MSRSASAVGLAKRGVIPQKQFYIKMFVFSTVILDTRAVYYMSTTRQLLERLSADSGLRRICGWETKGEISMNRNSLVRRICDDPTSAAVA